MSAPGALYFEDVEVGKELPVTSREISLEQMAMYAAVCWDFLPVHYDSGTAQKHGFRDAYVDGPMITAFLSELVTAWSGVQGRLRTIAVTYRGMAFPGDKLLCKGKITAKHVDGGSNLAECDIWAENQNGERVVYGTATVSLPTRPD
ncbi:MAG: hypothetical protein HYX92_07350 [Chloroflexi bacterium]|nr:hypothetical protein [Chloroflexota bacterium]